MPWEAIKYVTSGLTLVAFAIATAAWLYRKSLRSKESLIRSAPENERAALVDKTLEFFDVDTKGLTQDQQYNIAKEQIELRAQKTKLIANNAGLFAFLVAVIAIVAIVKTPAQPATGTVTNPEFIDVAFSIDTPLGTVVETVADARNVTILFDGGCDESIRAALVSKGNHTGNNIKEFLLNVKDRIKQGGIHYSVEKTGERRYEIICR